MDKKITLQDLAETLSQKERISQKDAERFLRIVFEVISDYLKTDKLVKVKGLGSFKLVTVDSRESVNINTGERIVIKAYTKVNFVPDIVLRDTINKPFAQFETVVLNEGTDVEEMTRINVNENVYNFTNNSNRGQNGRKVVEVGNGQNLSTKSNDANKLNDAIRLNYIPEIDALAPIETAGIDEDETTGNIIEEDKDNDVVVDDHHEDKIKNENKEDEQSLQDNTESPKTTNYTLQQVENNSAPDDDISYISVPSQNKQSDNSLQKATSNNSISSGEKLIDNEIKETSVKLNKEDAMKQQTDAQTEDVINNDDTDNINDNIKGEDNQPTNTLQSNKDNSSQLIEDNEKLNKLVDTDNGAQEVSENPMSKDVQNNERIRMSVPAEISSQKNNKNHLYSEQNCTSQSERYVESQNVELQKVEHLTVENQHIVQMMQGVPGKRIFLTRWMLFFLILLVLFLMAVSYYLGCTHSLLSAYMTPYKSVKADTSLSNSIPISQRQRYNGFVLSMPSSKHVRYTGKSNPSARKYIIIGTKSKYYSSSGETLQSIAKKFYGNEDLYVYIADYNHILNPDILLLNTMLKIPELKKKNEFVIKSNQKSRSYRRLNNDQYKRINQSQGF